MVEASILEKRYNVTIDNYFTSINLANKLKAEKLWLLDKKKQRKKVPKVEEIMKGKSFTLIRNIPIFF